MKPLEPGCLAYVTGGLGAGVTVTCIEHWPAGTPFIDARDDVEKVVDQACWLVDRPRDGNAIHDERNLTRIDGGDPDAVQEESQDQEVESYAHA